MSDSLRNHILTNWWVIISDFSIPVFPQRARSCDFLNEPLVLKSSRSADIVTTSPYHPAAQDRFPTEAKQGWAGQYLDGRPPGKTRLLPEEVTLWLSLLSTCSCCVVSAYTWLSLWLSLLSTCSWCVVSAYTWLTLWLSLLSTCSWCVVSAYTWLALWLSLLSTCSWCVVSAYT